MWNHPRQQPQCPDVATSLLGQIKLKTGSKGGKKGRKEKVKRKRKGNITAVHKSNPFPGFNHNSFGNSFLARTVRSRGLHTDPFVPIKQNPNLPRLPHKSNAPNLTVKTQPTVEKRRRLRRSMLRKRRQKVFYILQLCLLTWPAITCSI